MNKDKEQYKIQVNFVKCPSKEEMENRARKIISILVGNAIRMEREKIKKKGRNSQK